MRVSTIGLLAFQTASYVGLKFVHFLVNYIKKILISLLKVIILINISTICAKTGIYHP